MGDIDSLVKCLGKNEIIFGNSYHITADDKCRYGKNVSYDDYSHGEGRKVTYIDSGVEKSIHLETAIKEYLGGKFAEKHKIDSDTVDRFMNYLCEERTHVSANSFFAQIEYRFKNFNKHEQEEKEAQAEQAEQAGKAEKAEKSRTRKRIGVSAGTMLAGAVAVAVTFPDSEHDVPVSLDTPNVNFGLAQEFPIDYKKGVFYPKELGNLPFKLLKDKDALKKIFYGVEFYVISCFHPNNNEIITRKIFLCNQDEVNAGAEIIKKNEELKRSASPKLR